MQATLGRAINYRCNYHLLWQYLPVVRKIARFVAKTRVVDSLLDRRMHETTGRNKTVPAKVEPNRGDPLTGAVLTVHDLRPKLGDPPCLSQGFVLYTSRIRCHIGRLAS